MFAGAGLVHKLHSERFDSEFNRKDLVGEEWIEKLMNLSEWFVPQIFETLCLPPRQIKEKEEFLPMLHSTLTQFDFDTLYFEWANIPTDLPVLFMWVCITLRLLNAN